MDFSLPSCDLSLATEIHVEQPVEDCDEHWFPRGFGDEVEATTDLPLEPFLLNRSSRNQWENYQSRRKLPNRNLSIRRTIWSGVRPTEYNKQIISCFFPLQILFQHSYEYSRRIKLLSDGSWRWFSKIETVHQNRFICSERINVEGKQIDRELNKSYRE